MFKVTSFNTYSMEVTGAVTSNIFLGVGALIGFLFGKPVAATFFAIAFVLNLCWDLFYLIGTKKKVPIWMSSALVIKFLVFIIAYTVIASIADEFGQAEFEWYWVIYYMLTAMPFGFMMAQPIFCAHRKLYLEEKRDLIKNGSC